MATSRHCYVFGAVVVLFLCSGCSAQCTDRNRPKILLASFWNSSFSSPNYGFGDYPPNSNCSWRIQTLPGYVVRLDVSSVSMECDFDFVTIYDGFWKYARVIDHFCTSQFRTFHSSRRYMYITFTSDMTAQYSGFKFYYSNARATTTPTTTTTTTTPTTTTTTTTRPPWGELTTTTTSAPIRKYWSFPPNTVVVVGCLAGGLVILILFIVVCRSRYHRVLSRRSPHPTPPFTSTNLSSGPARGNNTVFMTSASGVQTTALSEGNVNLGYLPYSESPPSYDSLHPSGPPPESVALPSYSEAIKMSGSPETPKLE